MSVLKVEKNHHLAILTIDRPEAMNTMNGDLVDAFKREFSALNDDEDTRVIILTATGDRAFCAGADLNERRKMSEDEVFQRVRDYGFAFSEIENVRQPTICAINGYAFGGGLEIALACDIRVMAEETQLGLTETRIGILPGAGGTQRLPRIVGEARAKEMIFTAKRLTAAEALDFGIVSYIVPRAQLLEKAKEIANEVLKGAPVAIQEAKRAIHLGMQVSLEEGLKIEAECYGRTIPTEDRIEGLIAFKEKRPPDWQGK